LCSARPDREEVLHSLSVDPGALSLADLQAGINEATAAPRLVVPAASVL
jgi:hypothetical protein